MSNYFPQKPEKGWSLTTFVARRCSFAQTQERRGRGYVCSTWPGRSAVQAARMVFPAKRLCVVPSMEGVRWAFSCGTWLPSRAEWLLAVRSIQPEEKERIGQFVFARDAKAALVLEACGFWEAGRAADPTCAPVVAGSEPPECVRPSSAFVSRRPGALTTSLTL